MKRYDFCFIMALFVLVISPIAGLANPGGGSISPFSTHQGWIADEGKEDLKTVSIVLQPGNTQGIISVPVGYETITANVFYKIDEAASAGITVLVGNTTINLTAAMASKKITLEDFQGTVPVSAWAGAGVTYRVTIEVKCRCIPLA